MRRLSMISAMLLVASAAVAATLEETYDRTFDVRPGALFALENTNGRITIHSWDEARIRVIGRKTVESRDSDAARQAMAALKIDAVPSGGGLRVTTNYPRKSDGGFFDWIAGTNVSMNVEYDIAVPRTMDLNIDNTNGGIDISDINGALQVSNTNGHIEFARCAGSVEAETTNGGVRAELTAVNPGKKVSLETTNGRVAVTVPRSIGATIDASTTNGSINTELPITTNQMSRHALRGTVNGGGAEMRLRTTNGSIEIRVR